MSLYESEVLAKRQNIVVAVGPNIQFKRDPHMFKHFERSSPESGMSIYCFYMFLFNVPLNLIFPFETVVCFMYLRILSSFPFISTRRDW